MRKLQKTLSKQMLELLMFTNQWRLLSDKKDDHILITTGEHSILKRKNTVMYVDFDKDKKIEDWELFKLKYGVKDKIIFDRRIKSIVNGKAI